MFAQLRRFSFFICFFLAFEGAFFWYYCHQNDMHSITLDAEHNAMRAEFSAGGMLHDPGFRKSLNLYAHLQDSHIPVTEWKHAENYAEMMEGFASEATTLFRRLAGGNVVSVVLYASDGTPLRIVDEARAPKQNASDMPQAGLVPHNGTAFRQVLQGGPVSVYMPHDTFLRSDGMATEGNFVLTYLPLENADCVVADKNTPAEKACDGDTVTAIAQIRTDVTEHTQLLYSEQWFIALSAAVLCLGPLGMLLYACRKAETQIADDHIEVTDMAAQLVAAHKESSNKSQFLANVSHELRTPLNAIIGFAEFIRSERSGPMGSKIYAEYLQDIYNSGVHLLSLINDILDYSKAEADKLEMTINECDIRKTVRNSIRMVSPRAETAQVSVVENILAGDFVLMTDERKLKQIMLNLLSNALKFTAAGGSVTVTMWQNVLGGTVSIEVSDNGIGIAPEDIPRVMTPFGQVDNMISRTQEGTGLGLPLTKKFVEAMGGEFAIASELGKGTSITITLPKVFAGKSQPVA